MQMQHWLFYSELSSAPSPPYQAVCGCSLEPSWVYLPPAASHNLVAPLPTSRVLHHTAGAHSAICQHHLLDLLSQDYLLLSPHPFYQGFKACKQGVTIWKERLKKSETAVLTPSIFSFSFQHTNILFILQKLFWWKNKISLQLLAAGLSTWAAPANLWGDSLNYTFSISRLSQSKQLKLKTQMVDIHTYTWIPVSL